MVSLAIVATLSAVATSGVRNHFAHAKSAEAIQSVGGIGRAVAAAHASWTEPADVKQTGSTSSSSSSDSGKGKGEGQGPGGGATVTFGAKGLCGDAPAVPASMNSVKNRKYQPDNSPGRDYQTGNASTGWRCLGFRHDQAQHYQVAYKLGGPPISVRLPHGGTPPGLATASRWSAYARGDVDGDGVFSWFILQGYIKNDEIMMAAGISIQDQTE